jgi:hypothetical protein
MFFIILSDFNETWVLLTENNKNMQSTFSPVVPCGQMAWQMDRHDDANSHFRYFVNMPKNYYRIC